MAQAQFAHADWPESPPCNRAGDNGSPAVSLSLFADRAHVRATLCEDAEAAGLRIADARDLAALNDGAVRALGDVVMVDCPQVGGAELAALARLDMRAAHTGAQLVVSTSVDALDDVFGCLDQSGAQILVDPSRAERIVALGRALADAPGQQVRELAADDRITLIRLTEQVSRIAERLERLSASAGEAVVQSPRGAFALASNPDGDRLVAPPPAALPEPRVIRTMLRHRQARARFFDAELFADPAWDMTSKISGKSIYFKAAA